MLHQSECPHMFSRTEQQITLSAILFAACFSLLVFMFEKLANVTEIELHTT